MPAPSKSRLEARTDLAWSIAMGGMATVGFAAFAVYPLVERFAQHGIRRWPHGRYLIFYRTREAQVEIIHIRHGARDYGRLLELAL